MMNMEPGMPSQESQESERRQKMVMTLGGQLHDGWRAPRKKEDGTYEPRVKVLVKTAEGKEKWFDEDKVPAGSQELKRQDIANTKFDDLEPHWQAENRAAAEVAMGEVFKAADAGKPLDAAFVEEACVEVHKKWMERNSWADKKLMVPFAELPEDEKEKDRDQVRRAIEIFQQKV